MSRPFHLIALFGLLGLVAGCSSVLSGSTPAATLEQVHVTSTLVFATTEALHNIETQIYAEAVQTLAPTLTAQAVLNEQQKETAVNVTTASCYLGVGLAAVSGTLALVATLSRRMRGK